MRVKRFRWLLIALVGLFGCDPNPTGPSAPSASTAEPTAVKGTKAKRKISAKAPVRVAD